MGVLDDRDVMMAVTVAVALLPVAVAVVMISFDWWRYRRELKLAHNATLIADAYLARVRPSCTKPGKEHFCTRGKGHAGPCAVWPIDPRNIP